MTGVLVWIGVVVLVGAVGLVLAMVLAPNCDEVLWAGDDETDPKEPQ
jgi:hypothetical protein